MTNLFEQQHKQRLKDKPLAYRMRPRNLDEVFGQKEIIGKGKLLYRAIMVDRVQSLIFYGPPGSGKTSLANVIARQTEADFIKINAVTSGVKELRDVIKKSRENISLYNKKTILFIDEIHRFNKAQQDALLPAVEDGTLVMIGATTENPYFEVNSPLLSRSRIYHLNPLSNEDIISILHNALQDEERGLGSYSLDIDDEVFEHLALLANGDARSALNALELAVLSTPLDDKGKITITKEIISESIQKRIMNYDKDGDSHYDTISAFIKSMRGSDPDAALFYFARMLEAGEDPRFIARRMIIHAAEDVGLADPQALQIAVAAARALEFIGMPEAKIPMAEAVIYISTAPKSNSVVTAIDSVLDFVEKNPAGHVPPHLRDAHYQGADELGHGQGYLYPHDYPGNYVKQQYLPDGLGDLVFYKPGQEGNEQNIKERLKRWKEKDEK